ncbi:hypothetical protein WA026_008088 [Henosepilachna vigintioctopunctata]|uniref:Uncharacterized protein n=1 Tax=Henosepilachna vigintioctopunctata TaxID=420089 RepID=A0AAW1TPC6_9CUCU
MNKFCNDNEDPDSDTEADLEADPEQLLNEWLGELKTLSGAVLLLNKYIQRRNMCTFRHVSDLKEKEWIAEVVSIFGRYTHLN